MSFELIPNPFLWFEAFYQRVYIYKHSCDSSLGGGAAREDTDAVIRDCSLPIGKLGLVIYQVMTCDYMAILFNVTLF